MELTDVKAIAQQKIAMMESGSNGDILKMLWGKDFKNLCLTGEEERKLIRKGIYNLQYQVDLLRAESRRASKEISRLRQIEITLNVARIPGNGQLVYKTGEKNNK
jgi:hypothetical protein